MRYQGANSDILHHHPNNGKKPLVKICNKRDNDVENGGRHLNRQVLEGRGTLSMAGMKLKGGSSSTMNTDNNNIYKERENGNGIRNVSANGNGNAILDPLKEKSVEGNQPLKDPKEGGDVLFQWCRKKRARGHRPESRGLVEDSTFQGRKTIQIERPAAKPEKRRVIAQTQVTIHSRSTTLRPCTPLHETTSGLGRRNLDDLNGAHPINNGHHPRVDRNSSAPVEKHDKAAACPPPKANGPTTAADVMVYNSTPSETEAHAPAEKVNMDLFEWPRIFISLSRKEKEDDFLVMKGTKLSQRPKKRPKHVEKLLQNCFPGSWLSDLTRGRYEVREKKCIKKKPRGLKAMESSDSDSE
eukprot:Gb_29718 [translate_table: standard]